MIRRHRSQAGFSLLELLVVVSLSTLLVLSVTAWFLLVLRTQPSTEDGLVRVAQTGLLTSYLPKDLAVAGAAAVDQAMADELSLPPHGVNIDFEDCIGGAGTGGDVALVMTRGAGPELSRTVYVEVDDGVDDGGDTGASIWRRQCDASGQNTTATQLVENVEPGSVVASCSIAELPACRSIEVRLRSVGQTDDLVVFAVRRVDQAVASEAAGGNRLPVGKIDVVNQSPAPPYEVTFSSGRSHDPDGHITCYEWVIPVTAEGREPVEEAERVTIEVPPPGAPADASPGDFCPDGAVAPSDPGDDPQVLTRTFPTSGVYYVELTVTDDRGSSSTTYRRLEVVPPPPVAQLQVVSVDGGDAAGRGLFEFSARWFSQVDGTVIGSEALDPDFPIIGYQWVITAAGGGPDSIYVAVRDDPDPFYLALPPEFVTVTTDPDTGFEIVVGTVSVSLTVLDELGRTSTADAVVTLSPGATPSDPALLGPGLHPPPTGLALVGPTGADAARLTWSAPELVERYHVQTDSTGPGCARSRAQIVDVTPPGEPLVQALLPNQCESTKDGDGNELAAMTVRVGAELAGTISWSEPLAVTVPAFRVPPPVEPDPVPPEGGP